MKVSVIIPCFNVSKYLPSCLQSLNDQTYQDIEIICVNDGSSDDTLDVIHKFKKKLKYPFQIIDQDNRGAAVARNKGLEVANGDYIQFLDADDILLPSKIERQISIAILNNIPDIIIGSYQKQRENGAVQFTKQYTFNYEIAEIWQMLMTTNLGITSSNLFNSKCFEENSVNWNTSLKSSQEYDLMFQILKKNVNISFSSDIDTCIITRDSGSISQSNIKENWVRYVDLRSNVFKHLTIYSPEIADTQMIKQALFNAIRMLYPYDNKLANEYYSNYLGVKFCPIPDQINSRKYILMYKIFGLNWTEKAKQLL